MELVVPDGTRSPVENGATVTTPPQSMNFQYFVADGKCTLIRFGSNAARKEQSAPYWLLGDKSGPDGTKVPIFTVVKAGTYPVKVETWSDYDMKGTKGETFAFTLVVATPAPPPPPSPTIESLQKQVDELSAVVSRAEKARDDAIDSARQLTTTNVALAKERDAAIARAQSAEKSAAEGQAALLAITQQFAEYKASSAEELKAANDLIDKFRAQGPPAIQVDFGDAMVTKNADGTYRVEVPQ
jgi:hypothetical protein